MRILIITQDDPFYLPKNLDYLLNNLPDETRVVGCVVSKVSPFGKKESFFRKMLRTFRIFGAGFFLRYAIDFVKSRMPHREGVRDVLYRHGITRIEIAGSLNTPAALATLGADSPDLLISIAGNEIFRKPFDRIGAIGLSQPPYCFVAQIQGVDAELLGPEERRVGDGRFCVLC